MILKNLRLYLLAAAFIGGALAVYLYGESREEDGYNRAVAEQQAAIAEWQRIQREEFEKELKKERAHAVTLETDLSTLQGKYDALQSEVSNAPLVKPKPALPGVPDCSAHNPLTPEFGRLFNAGARGERAAAATDPGAGDGELPGSFAAGAR